MPMRKVIITGPTGVIGHALITKCIKEQTEVYAVCRKESARVNTIPSHPSVHVIECELENLEQLTNILPTDCDAFYHFAWMGTVGNARNDMYLQNLNVKYALDAVELCRKIHCRTYVGAGSQAEYGRVENVIAPDTPVFPETGYGMAKLCAGQMTRMKCQQYGIAHIWARILSIYGPFDGMGSMIMSVIQKLLDNQPVPLTKGEQIWDYLYADDVAEAMYLLGERGIDGKVYCIGSGRTRPLRDYVMDLCHSVENSTNRHGLEYNLKFGEIPYGERQVMRLCADISDLQTDVGFEPKVSFAEGIMNTVQFCIERQRGLL